MRKICHIDVSSFSLKDKTKNRSLVFGDFGSEKIREFMKLKKELNLTVLIREINYSNYKRCRVIIKYKSKKIYEKLSEKYKPKRANDFQIYGEFLECAVKNVLSCKMFDKLSVDLKMSSRKIIREKI